VPLPEQIAGGKVMPGQLTEHLKDTWENLPLKVISKHYATLGDQSRSREMALPFSVGCGHLPQVRVLRLGSDENGNVRVGIFPEREEIPAGGPGARRSN